MYKVKWNVNFVKNISLNFTGDRFIFLKLIKPTQARNRIVIPKKLTKIKLIKTLKCCH